MPRISAAKKDERRSQILQAAIWCFARNGFHRTTIQDICEEAGLSHGAVYGYFDSKDAIIAALTGVGRKINADRVAASQRTSSSPIEQLRALLAALEHPEAAIVNQFDVRAWGEAIGDAQLREITLRSRADLIAALTAIAAPAAAAKGLAPEALAQLIAAVIVGCEVQRAIEPASDIRPQLDALLALLEPGAGPGPRRPYAPAPPSTTIA